MVCLLVYHQELCRAAIVAGPWTDPSTVAMRRIWLRFPPLGSGGYNEAVGSGDCFGIGVSR